MINKPGKCGKDTEIRVLFVCPGKSGIRTPKFSFRLFRYFCRGKAETDAFGSIQINPNVLIVKSGTSKKAEPARPAAARLTAESAAVWNMRSLKKAKISAPVRRISGV